MEEQLSAIRTLPMTKVPNDVRMGRKTAQDVNLTAVVAFSFKVLNFLHGTDPSFQITAVHSALGPRSQFSDDLNVLWTEWRFVLQSLPKSVTTEIKRAYNPHNARGWGDSPTSLSRSSPTAP